MPKSNGSIASASIAVTLDGREYSLRFSALAFIRYAEVLDRDLLADVREVGQRAQESGGMMHSGQMFMRVRDILWAGMLDQQPDTDRDQVAHLFGLGDLARIMPAIVEALNGTMSGAARGDTARPTKAPRARHVSGHLTDGSGSGPTSATDQESAQPNSSA